MNLRVAFLWISLAIAVPASDWTCSPAVAQDVSAGRVTTTSWSTTAAEGSRRAFTSTSLLLTVDVSLRLVEQPVADKERARSVADVMAASGAVAAMNGGYFTKEFAPAGLLVVEGREVSSRSSETALSGILAVDAAGKLSLRLRDDALDNIAYARQAGPFLVDPGGAMGIRPSDHPSYARRSVVLLTTDGRVALVATTDVSLYDLATCLHDHPDGFGVVDVERALNMDGGPSTALCIKGLEKPSVMTERAPVRDVVVVVVVVTSPTSR